MRAWRFDDATTLLDQAEAVLGQRPPSSRRRQAAGLTAAAHDAGGLRGRRRTGDATAEATAELEAIDRYPAAVAQPADRRRVRSRRWGSGRVRPTPTSRAAREAFARGDSAGRRPPPTRPTATWARAGAIGQGRAMSLAVLLLAVRADGPARRRVHPRPSPAPSTPDARPPHRALTAREPGRRPVPRRAGRAIHSPAPPPRRPGSWRSHPEEGAHPPDGPAARTTVARDPVR